MKATNLSEAVEMSTLENSRFAREMLDAGAWTREMAFEYLNSKLEIITEIEIEAVEAVESLIIDYKAIVEMKGNLGKRLGEVDYTIFSSAVGGVINRVINTHNLTGKLATYNELFDGWNKPKLFNKEALLFEYLVDSKLARYED